MGVSRVFLGQEALDHLVVEGRATVDGDMLRVSLVNEPSEARTFCLKTAVHVVREVTETGDPAGLVGKVKDLEQIAALGGEYCANSLLVSEAAYDVFEGFVGVPVAGSPAESKEALSIDAREVEASTGALRSALSGAGAGKDADVDLLARFLRSNGS